MTITLSEHETTSGLKLAEITLDQSETLNALSLSMVRSISEAIEGWRNDPSIVALLLTGAGEKAFCAGGDIQALYRGVVANQEAGEVVDTYPFDFFCEEYRLDYQLHTYPIPVICLGHGIVMGGGLGLYSASRFRVATTTSRIALPEITIGLFPDAGATWTLRNTEPSLASFLGLTGASINATDALEAGWATHVIDDEARPQFVESICALSWLPNDPAQNGQLLSTWLDGRCSLPNLPSNLAALPRDEPNLGDLGAEYRRLKSLKGQSEWIDKAISAMERGCPTTGGIILEQLRRSPALSLEECMQMELVIATHCATNSEFREGVRALLIDKDRTPQWRNSWDAPDDKWVQSHFVPPWATNPLADLGSRP